MELDEAIRLYELNKDSELTIHGKYNKIDLFDVIIAIIINVKFKNEINISNIIGVYSRFFNLFVIMLSISYSIKLCLVTVFVLLSFSLPVNGMVGYERVVTRGHGWWRGL